jgi:DNA-binding Xre family transcriptional regulator
VKWNLRLAAANRGIWKASELQHLLADHGLTVSAGKMSGLWSGHPISIRLDDLDVICAALDCRVGELLIPEQVDTIAVAEDEQAPKAVGQSPAVVPRLRSGRTLPPR